MGSSYSDLVTHLRTAFPAPVSDRLHDAYFVFSFLRALDQVDALKSAAPMLGAPVTLDYAQARLRRMADDPSTLEAVTSELVQYLSGMFIWGHPRSQINVVPSPTIPSLIGGLLPSIYNPNLVSEESSRQVSLAEVEVIAMTAALVGYEPATADGVFTFGGTGTLLYGAKIGLEKALPGARTAGLREPAVIIGSDCAHYACLTVANWLGLGEAQFLQVPSTDADSTTSSACCVTRWRPGVGSPASSRRWAPPMRSGWTTSKAWCGCVTRSCGSTGSTTCRTCMPTR